MLVRWIPETPDTFPANASHRVGVAVLVVNDKKEVIFFLIEVQLNFHSLLNVIFNRVHIKYFLSFKKIKNLYFLMECIFFNFVIK